MKILIVGSTTKTAGIGGVAVHVERLLESLEQRGVNVIHKDYKESGVQPFIFAITADVLHLHSQNKKYSFLLTLFAKLCRTKVVYTLHQKYETSNSLDWRLCNWMFRLVDKIIVLNTQSRDDIKAKLGIDTELQPAFIPPSKVEPLDDAIMEVLNTAKKKNLKICVTNAAFYTNNTSQSEVYGISFLVDQFSKMNDCFLVVSDPSGQNKANIPCTSENIYFIDYKHPYYTLLQQADMSIRNTSTDGDALSVKESLSLGVPTLCSDVVDRPEQAILFKYSDEVTFLQAIKIAKNQEKKEINFENPVDRLIKIYLAK